MQSSIIIWSGLGGILLFVAIFTYIEHSVSGHWWFIPQKFRPQAGEIRCKKTFLWHSKTIKGITRFWEKAEIIQVFSEAGTATGYDWTPAHWVDVEWGEFVEDVEIEYKFSMFGNPRGEIHPKKRDGVLVVFAERRVR